MLKGLTYTESDSRSADCAFLPFAHPFLTKMPCSLQEKAANLFLSINQTMLFQSIPQTVAFVHELGGPSSSLDHDYAVPSPGSMK